MSQPVPVALRFSSNHPLIQPCHSPTNVFEACYQVEDGYVTGSRPQTFKINAEDLPDDMDNDEALRKFYDNEVSTDFQDSGKIYPQAQRVDQFVAWAKARLAERETDSP